MNVVKCPKCNYGVEINISKAIDEYAEVFICNSCGYKFRYAPNG